MNERIKELKKQAARWVCENEPRSMGDDQLFDELYEKKYAELIVRECADLVDRTISDGVDGRVVKEHFGVKDEDL